MPAAPLARASAQLLRAEQARREGRLGDAEHGYEAAIAMLRGGDERDVEAHVLEQAARFYEETGRTIVAKSLQAQARASLERKRGQTATDAEHAAERHAPASGAVGDIDVTTVIALSQAVASEIVLERLIAQLMTLAVEHAGASRALLLLERAGELKAAAEATANSTGVAVRTESSSSRSALPESVLRYVSRSREVVIIDDASVSGPHTSDPYFQTHDVRSLMAFPLVVTDGLAGVLYLENDLASHVFTEARMGLLRLFASQASIALENARLFDSLRRSQQYRVEAQRLSNTGSFVWHRDTSLMRWSEQSYRIYEYTIGSAQTPERMLARTYPEDLPRARTELARDEIDTELRIAMPDGRIKHLQIVARVARPSTPHELSGAIIDVTARREAEQRLREARHRFAVTLASIADGVIATNADGTVSYMNPVAEVLTGYGSDALGVPLERVLLLVNEKTAPVLHGRDGREIPVEVRRSVLAAPGEEQEGSVVVLRDISQRRLAEEARTLAAANERLEFALRGSNVGVWDVDYRDRTTTPPRIYTINFWESLGWQSPPEFRRMLREAGRTDARPERFHPEDRARAYERLDAHLRGETQELETEMRTLAPDGSWRWCLIRGRAVHDERGNLLRVIGTSVDITDRHTLETKIRAATLAAEEANRAKDEFLANVSHEIRTPMNAILGMTELVLDTQLPREQRHWMSTVKSAADELLVTIDELLEFAKAAANKLELSLADLPLHTHLEHTLRAMAATARSKGLALLLDVADDVPSVVCGDAVRLRQILVSLVGNAIKFTSGGQVGVSVRLLRELPESRELELAFAIRDTGIGISVADRALIFEPFAQADVSTTRRFGGTGLGLTIAARLARLMGGRIDVESERDVGSTFTVTVRLGAASATVSSPRVVLPMDLRVLIVGVNPPEQVLVTRWLESSGANVHAVADGLAAVEALWDAIIAQQPFDVALLDFSAPALDVSLLARRVREGGTLSGCRLVTLDGRHEDGVSLEKPFSKPSLLDAIARAVAMWSDPTPHRVSTEAPPRGASHDTQAQANATRALRILVAEDSEFNADLVRALIRRRGHVAVVVDNGTRALELAGEGGFDVLLLDLHMPGLDGFQVIERLRAHERLVGGHLPVIALTARSRVEDRDQCIAAGMDEFLGKPIRSAALWEVVDRITDAPARG